MEPTTANFVNDQESAHAGLPDYDVRISARAKRARIRISRGLRVEIVVPESYRKEWIPELVASRADWIHKTLRKMKQAGCVSSADLKLPHRVDLPGIGLQVQVVHQPSPGQPRLKYRTTSLGGTLTFSGSIPPSDPAPWRTLLLKWLASTARHHLPPMAATVASELGTRFSKIRISRQKTRWGSCSARGIISLNCNLLFLSPAQVRYLLIHELCHTKEMNHSQNFWKLVARYEPNWVELDKSLNAGWKQIPDWAQHYR